MSEVLRVEDIPQSARIIIISAPSGTGKTTVIQGLLNRMPDLEFSVSATTRAPRPHETDGRDYHFLSQEAFEARKQAGAFIEWEEVYPGRYYGTPYSEITRILDGGHYPVFEIDVNGGINLKQQFGSRALAMFLKPPSLDVLEQRLRNRGTENTEDFNQRLWKSVQEMEMAPRFDVVVVNQQLEQAISEATQHIETFLHA